MHIDREAEGLAAQLTLGGFREFTRDMPDDTLIVTAGMDEYGVADARMGTVRIVPFDSSARSTHAAVYETPERLAAATAAGRVEPDAVEFVAVFVDLNDLAWPQRDGE